MFEKCCVYQQLENSSLFQEKGIKSFFKKDKTFILPPLDLPRRADKS
jgi:hypothetical protein